MTTTFLDNIFWHALTGPHAVFAVGEGAARRYAPGFSPISAFAEPQQPDLAALAPFVAPGEHLYCAGWTGPAPAGWKVDLESTMFRMAWQGALPADEAPDALPLGPEYCAQAAELAALTKPGPFGPRTIELGEYFGYVEDGRLIAMAGERTHAGAWREVSGVCTHPGHQGKGLARRLMLKLIHRQMQRGETPFLHVMRENIGARALYRRMGFADHAETPIRVVSAV